MDENNLDRKNTIKIKLSRFHDKYYKHLLILPLIIFLLCFFYLFYFYTNTKDFIYKDLSLTGGTTVTFFYKGDLNNLKTKLGEGLEGLNVREISDFMTGERKAIIIETKSNPEITKKVLEKELGFQLNEENSSIEFTEPSLGVGFFNQLIISLLIAFSFMGWVIFLIFGNNTKIKIFVGVIIITTAIINLSFLSQFNKNLSIFLSAAILLLSMFIYIFYSIPSIAIILSAFADIFMTVSLLNFLGIEMSTAGIVALLMLIGYSVDTDILLTNRVLKNKEESLNRKIFSSFNTGITMTLTAIFSIGASLLVVRSYSPVLTKIFTVLLIGLCFDIINTWVTNVSLLKWYILKKG